MGSFMGVALLHQVTRTHTRGRFDRSASGVVPCRPSALVTAEGLLEPPCGALRGDLGVDEQRALARSRDPVGDRRQVARGAYGDGLAAEPAADRRDVDGWEPDDVQRVIVGSEMMDLRAIGLVV